MKTISTLAILLLVVTGTSTAQVYKSTKPLIIKDEVYNVMMSISPSIMDSTGAKMISLSFYLITNQQGNSFEEGGGYRHIKKVYVVDRNLNNKTTVNLVPDLSTNIAGRLKNYTRCYVRGSGDDMKIILSNGMSPEKISIDFGKVESKLFDVSAKDAMPDGKAELDEAVKAATDTSVASNADAEYVKPEFRIRIAGDIDNRDFPDNLSLRTILAKNREFVFKTTMDLYLDMMRFKAVSYDYDKDKIRNFLYLHDLWYFKYERNEPVLEKKIQACVDLLREASSRFNKGDIFYKDYTVDLSKVNYNNNPVTLLQYDPVRDDLFKAKRVKGEPDRYYSENGLNVYLTNWTTMSSTSMTTKPQVDSSNQLTLRIYFMLQPLPAFSMDGEFKGVTAYGLKAIVFRDCPYNYIASFDNKNIQNIEDPELKQLYVKASDYLYKVVKQGEANGEINTAGLYQGNYFNLGKWYQAYPECQQAYTYLAGKAQRTSTQDALISLRMMTNYACTMQAGYEVTFSNRFSGVSFSLPVMNASITQSESSEGYYDILVKVDPLTLRKMVEANVNSVTCQCLGAPRYKVANKYSMPYPNAVITNEVQSLSAPVDVGEDRVSNKLLAMLRRAL